MEPPRDQTELDERIRQLPHARAQWVYVVGLALLATVAGLVVVVRALVVGVDELTGTSVFLFFVAGPLWHLAWRGRAARRITEPVESPPRKPDVRRARLELWVAAVGLVLLGLTSVQGPTWLTPFLSIAVAIALVRVVRDLPSEYTGKPMGLRTRVALALGFAVAFFAIGFVVVAATDGIWSNVYAGVLFGGSAGLVGVAALLVRRLRA